MHVADMQGRPYRIKTVAILSGVSSATLRAWERRYGVPTPLRSEGDYRLYDENDVALVMRMRELVSTGISTREAARRALAAQAAPLGAGPTRAGPRRTDASRRQSTGPRAPEGLWRHFAPAVRNVVAAALRLDAEALGNELSRATALAPATTVFDEVLAPALRCLGEAWREAPLVIAQEHFASQLVGGALAQLLRIAQPRRAAPHALLACVDGESHSHALCGVGLHLASWGVRTTMLGPRTPARALAPAVSTLAPDLIALTATLPLSKPRAQRLATAYAAAAGHRPWLVGGRAALAHRGVFEAAGAFVAPAGPGSARAYVEAVVGGATESRP